MYSWIKSSRAWLSLYCIHSIILLIHFPLGNVFVNQIKLCLTIFILYTKVYFYSYISLREMYSWIKSSCAWLSLYCIQKYNFTHTFLFVKCIRESNQAVLDYLYIVYKSIILLIHFSSWNVFVNQIKLCLIWFILYQNFGK